MALNTLKCNNLTSLGLKGLKSHKMSRCCWAGMKLCQIGLKLTKIY